MSTKTSEGSYGKNDSVEVDIDEAIYMIGSFGRYQKLVVFCVCFIRIAMLCHVFILYFVANDPP